VLNYFSNRIHTIGTRSFKDIIEEGIPTLHFVTSYKFNKNFTFKLNITNLFDPYYQLTRKASGQSDEKHVLNKYKKGRNISLGISYEL
jgi:outer membrane receptor protein involved in Fe transport